MVDIAMRKLLIFKELRNAVASIARPVQAIKTRVSATLPTGKPIAKRTPR